MNFLNLLFSTLDKSQANFNLILGEKQFYKIKLIDLIYIKITSFSR